MKDVYMLMRIIQVKKSFRNCPISHCINDFHSIVITFSPKLPKFLTSDLPASL